MKIKSCLALGITISLLCIGAKFVFAQEGAGEEQMAPQSQNELETQWVWGEVTNIDPLVKAITIKYLDYETDQEKEIKVTCDDKTNYENIKSMDEIKLKDTLSIDYMPGPDGKNIAKNISVERPEGGDNTLEGPKAEEQKAPAAQEGQAVSAPEPSSKTEESQPTGY